MSQLEGSYLDMVVAGTESAVLMVESEAKELTEDQMLGAVLYAHQEMQVVIRAINEFCEVVGVESWDWTPEPVNQLVDGFWRPVPGLHSHHFAELIDCTNDHLHFLMRIQNRAEHLILGQFLRL